MVILLIRLRLLIFMIFLMASGLASCAGVSNLKEKAVAGVTGTHGQLVTGWTHGRCSPDGPFRKENITAAKAILRDTATLQNVQIMGWGLNSPSLAPGQYDFSRLDRRMAMVQETGGIPVITLCCSPDWMNGGEAGKTDWHRFAIAPLPEHFDDFAELSARIAQRYPEVKYFLVWNELKGFYNFKLDRWNYESYTDLYNKVYRAIKAVRPDAQIGGPYVVMGSFDATYPYAKHLRSSVAGKWGFVMQSSLDVVDYWLKNKAGADFVTVDGSIKPRVGEVSIPPLEGLQKFAAINQWLRTRTALPIWWAELYPTPVKMPESAAPDQAIAALKVIAESGGSVVLFWNPNCQDDIDYGKGVCLWSDIRSANVQPSAFAKALKNWRTNSIYNSNIQK